jgi:lipopolysaccharide transport system permease protein
MSDTAKNDDGDWSLVIRPKRKWLDIDLREIYRYRDLILLFVKRDFITVYKQTILGPLWFILNPLFTTIIYSFVFGNLAAIPTDGIPQTMFYYSGTMLWNYFTACLNSGADVFSGNAGLFSKVYFPRLTVPISKVFSNLISFGIQFATLIVFYAYFVATGSAVRPTWWIIAFPLVIVQLAALGMGFGMIISSLTTKYRDLKQLISFGISLWMYATPIVYPMSELTTRYPEYTWLMMLNPVSVPVELFRAILFNRRFPSLEMLIASIVLTVIIVFAGLLLFNRNERTFVDVV